MTNSHLLLSRPRDGNGSTARRLRARRLYARGASVGESRAARSEGYSPATPPATTATSTPPPSATGESAALQLA